MSNNSEKPMRADPTSPVTRDYSKEKELTRNILEKHFPPGSNPVDPNTELRDTSADEALRPVDNKRPKQKRAKNSDPEGRQMPLDLTN